MTMVYSFLKAPELQFWHGHLYKDANTYEKDENGKHVVPVLRMVVKQVPKSEEQELRMNMRLYEQLVQKTCDKYD